MLTITAYVECNHCRKALEAYSIPGESGFNIRVRVKPCTSCEDRVIKLTSDTVIEKMRKHLKI